jgi:hypothetical protein
MLLVAALDRIVDMEVDWRQDVQVAAAAGVPEWAALDVVVCAAEANWTE